MSESNYICSRDAKVKSEYFQSIVTKLDLKSLAVTVCRKMQHLLQDKANQYVRPLNLVSFHNHPDQKE